MDTRDLDEDSRQPQFRCRTLGQLALYRGGPDQEPLMRAGKPLALLAYLALSPDSRADRDHIAELLWPHSVSTDPRHALRQVIYRLRAATDGRDLVVSEGGNLALTPQVSFDCLDLEASVSEGDLETAVAFSCGTFLGDFGLPESREFEEWAEARRTAFRGLWAEAATAVIEQKLEEGQPKMAIPIAERLVALKPFAEEPTRLHMLALAAVGSHALALSRFAVYADQLAAQGDEPSERLRSYAAELGRFVRYRSNEPEPGLPFVGRSEEWSLLERLWAETTAGSGGTVLIEGAAGLGKTRLIEELRARVEAGEGVVLSAKCYEPEQSIPYGAIAEALAPMSAQPELEAVAPAWLAEAARLLPELRERYPELPEAPRLDDSEASKRRLHQSLARCLDAVAETSDVLLTLDDLHWADPASLEVVHTLVHQLRNRRVLLLATYRPAELSPAARSFARSLCSTALARLCTLSPLSRTEVSDLLTSLGSFDDFELQTDVSSQLHTQSGGNPLFLAELLDALARDGTLFRREHRWIWSGDTRLSELPRTIGKLLADRIDNLRPWMRGCVECLAVAADDVSVDVLARAVGISEPRAELALTVLEKERLTKRSGADGFELIHDEFRRLVYHGIPDHRRALLHAAVGRALLDPGAVQGPGTAARLVYHFDQAGDVEQARRYALLAAGEASQLSAPDALRAHLEMAAAHSPKPLPPRSSSTSSDRPQPSRQPWRERLLWSATAGLVGSYLCRDLRDVA